MVRCPNCHKEMKDEGNIFCSDDCWNEWFFVNKMGGTNDKRKN